MGQQQRKLVRGDYVRVMQTDEMNKLGIGGSIATIVNVFGSICKLSIKGKHHSVDKSSLEWMSVSEARKLRGR